MNEAYYTSLYVGYSLWAANDIVLCTATPSYMGIETIDCNTCDNPYDYSDNTDTFTDTEIDFWDWMNTGTTPIA